MQVDTMARPPLAAILALNVLERVAVHDGERGGVGDADLQLGAGARGRPVEGPAVEDARRVRRHGDGGADLVLEGGALVDGDGVAGAAQRDRACETCDAGADDGDAERRWLFRGSGHDERVWIVVGWL